jgi:RNA polymerase sigma-70 factor, ECF subfamily
MDGQRGMVDRGDMDDSAEQADIRASLAGDAQAYRRIVLGRQEAMARRMRRFARSTADVEELVHEVFVQAYFSLAKYSGRSPFEHWLNRIGTRVGYKYWKRRGRESGERVDLEKIAAAEKGTPSEAAEAIEELMRQLSVRDRLVLTLLYLEERSVQETAQQVGWTKTMVKVQAFRARSKLKKLLAKSGITEASI